jgi:hypothetical protein
LKKYAKLTITTIFVFVVMAAVLIMGNIGPNVFGQIIFPSSPSISSRPLPNPTPPTIQTQQQQQKILPIANAGPNQLVISGSTVRLDGSHSYDENPGGNIIVYRWLQTGGVPVNLVSSASNGVTSGGISNTNTAFPVFTAPTVSQGAVLLTFSLAVTDNYGLTSTNPAAVAILVKPAVGSSSSQNPLLNNGIVGNGLNQLNPNQLKSSPFTSLLPPSLPSSPITPPVTTTTSPLSPLTPSSPPNTGNTQQQVNTAATTTTATFTEIYAPKTGGRVFTAMNPSGGICKSDGIRFNIANQYSLVDRETTWIVTLNNNPSACTSSTWWSPKIGSHGSTGVASGLYEASGPYAGGFKSMRSEGPHPDYHSCSGYIHGNVPVMPKGIPVGIKTATWRISNGVHVEFWYDFTGGGKGPWVKYASLDDTTPGHCNGGSITGPIGMNGMLIGPAPAQDTMRMNGADATYNGGSIVEIAAGQAPKGTVGSSVSGTAAATTTTAASIASAQPSSTLGAATPSPSTQNPGSITQVMPPSPPSPSLSTPSSLPPSQHPIVKKPIFDKGQSDGARDAQLVAKSTRPTSHMTSDDVDCESPDNLIGQDSIDYCTGYQQGVAEQYNMLLGR